MNLPHSLKSSSQNPCVTAVAPSHLGEGGRRPGEGDRENHKPESPSKTLGNSLDTGPFPSPSARRRPSAAFTLLEVMIAIWIFFVCIFAILEVVATNLRAARVLQNPPADVSLVIDDLYQTNKLEEGSDSGDFGKVYPGYEWASETTLAGTNGLFKVEFLVTRHGGGPNSDTHMTVLLWRPDSPQKLP